MTFPVLWMYARDAPPSDIIMEVLEEWKLDKLPANAGSREDAQRVEAEARRRWAARGGPAYPVEK